jgi:hypothetical protein
MAINDSTIGLLIKLRADESQATAAIKRFRNDATSELAALARSVPGGSVFASFITEANRASQSPKGVGTDSAAAGAAIGGIASPVALAAGAIVGLVTVGAALTVGTWEMVKSTSEQTAKLGDLSTKAGFTIETFSALSSMFEKSGGNAELLSTGLVKFTNNLGAAEAGSKRMQATLGELGVKTFTDSEKALSQFVAKFATLQTAEDRVQAASAAFGARTGAAFVTLFNDVGGDMDKFKERMKGLGGLITEEERRQADTLDDLRTQVQQQLGAAEREFAQHFYPIAIEALQGVSDWLRRNGKDFGSWAESVVSSLHTAGSEVQLLGNLITSLAAKLPALEQAKQSAAAGYNAYVTAIKVGLVQGGLATGLLTPKDQSEVNGELAQQILDKGAQFIKDQRAKAAGGTDYQPSGGGGGKRKGGGGGGEDDATRDFIKGLEIKQRAAERSYRETTEAADRSYERRMSTLAEWVKAETDAAEKVKTAQLATIDAEIAAAEKLHKGRDVKIAELNEKRAAAESEYNKRIRDIGDHKADEQIATLRAKQEVIYKIHEESDKQAVAAYRDAADRRLISAETAEKLIGQVELTALDKKKKRVQDDLELMNEQSEAYKQLHYQLGVIETERLTLEEEVARRVRDAHEKDLAEQREFNDRLIALDNEAMQRALEVGQARIDDLERRGDARSTIMRRQLDHDLASEALRHAQELTAIRQQQDEDAAKARTTSDFLDVLKKYDQLIEIENVRHADAMQRTKEQDYAAKNAGAISGEFRGALPTFDEDGNVVKEASAAQNAIAGLSGALVDARNMGREAFRSFADGIGATVKNFVLLGTTGPQALRKITASVLAELAQQATVKAVMAFADGLIHLFTNPAQSAADFAAAALYTGLAAGSGLAGRAIAGDSFKNKPAGAGAGAAAGASINGSRGSASSSSSDKDPIKIEENRGTVRDYVREIVVHREVIEVNHQHRIEPPPGWTVSEVKNDFNRNGSLRNMLRMDLLGEPSGG